MKVVCRSLFQPSQPDPEPAGRPLDAVWRIVFIVLGLTFSPVSFGLTPTVAHYDPGRSDFPSPVLISALSNRATGHELYRSWSHSALDRGVFAGDSQHALRLHRAAHGMLPDG